MAASMEVCKLLYNAGELSKALEPGRIVKGKENEIQEELLKDVIGLSQKKLFHQQVCKESLSVVSFSLTC